MKLLNLVPVIGDAWTDEMGQYVFKYLRPDTQVETWNLKHGGTSSIAALATQACAPRVKWWISRCLAGLSR